jgi:hypothetical protein
VSKNLAEPSTQRFLAGNSYRISQLERRPITHTVTRTDYAFAQASVTATVSGTYTVTNWIYSETSNTDLFEVPPGLAAGDAIQMSAGNGGVFLARATVENVGGATNVFYVQVQSSHAEGMGGQNSSGSEFQGYWKGTVWGGTQKPSWLRNTTLYREVYNPLSVIEITWGVQIVVVAGGSMSWSGVDVYLEVLKLGDEFQEVQLY